MGSERSGRGGYNDILRNEIYYYNGYRRNRYENNFIIFSFCFRIGLFGFIVGYYLC